MTSSPAVRVHVATIRLRVENGFVDQVAGGVRARMLTCHDTQPPVWTMRALSTTDEVLAAVAEWLDRSINDE